MKMAEGAIGVWMGMWTEVDVDGMWMGCWWRMSLEFSLVAGGVEAGR